jgi:hypothetical protein
VSTGDATGAGDAIGVVDAVCTVGSSGCLAAMSISRSI